MQIGDQFNHQLPEQVFEFRGVVRNLLVMVVLVCICVFLGVVTMYQESMVTGLLVLIGPMLPLLVAGSIFLISKADIVIDHKSISRRIFDKTIQHIEWSDIQEVTTFPVGDGRAKDALLGINIVPRSSNRHWFLPRKIWLTERPDNVADLILTLNQYITEHNIRVKKTVNGVTTSSTAI